MKINNLHHIGIAVNSIKKSMEFHTRFLGMTQESPVVEDATQNVKVVLLRPERGSLIELVEPLNEASPVNNILKQNSCLYHYCSEVNNIEEAIRTARSFGAMVIQSPVPATLFNQRKIAFIYTQDKYIVEFLETGSTQCPSENA